MSVYRSSGKKRKRERARTDDAPSRLDLSLALMRLVLLVPHFAGVVLENRSDLLVLYETKDVNQEAVVYYRKMWKDTHALRRRLRTRRLDLGHWMGGKGDVSRSSGPKRRITTH